jgi:hypothetical protein
MFEDKYRLAEKAESAPIPRTLPLLTEPLPADRADSRQISGPAVPYIHNATNEAKCTRPPARERGQGHPFTWACHLPHPTGSDQIRVDLSVSKLFEPEGYVESDGNGF